MHYQWLVSVFLKSTSRDQLLQKASSFKIHYFSIDKAVLTIISCFDMQNLKKI